MNYSYWFFFCSIFCAYQVPSVISTLYFISVRNAYLPRVISALYFFCSLCLYTQGYFCSLFNFYSVRKYPGLFPLYISSLLCAYLQRFFPIYISSLLCAYLQRFISALYFVSTLCVSAKGYFRSIFHLYSVRKYPGLFPLYSLSLLCAYLPWNRKNQSPKSNDQRKLKLEQIRLLVKKRWWNTYYNCYEFCWC